MRASRSSSAPGIVRSGDDRSRVDVLGHDDRDVLAGGRVGDHVVVEDPLGQRRNQPRDVELEDAPAALEQRRVELPEPARVGLRGLAGMEVRSRGAPDVEREVEGLVDRLHGGTSRVEPALRDAADVPALVRELLAARQVDARELEQPDRRRCPRRH